MAQRRMFAHSVVRTDRFMSLPFEAQSLYLQLGMEGDDDGFVYTPRSLARAIGCDVKMVDLLVEQGYLIAFESGVVAIVHWRANNTLKNDRYKPTACREEFRRLERMENGTYRLLPPQNRQKPAAPEPRSAPVLENEIVSGSQAEPEQNFFGSILEPEPNVTQPNVTQPNVTQPNLTQPNPIRERVTGPDTAEQTQTHQASAPQGAPTTAPARPEKPEGQEKTSARAGALSEKTGEKAKEAGKREEKAHMAGKTGEKVPFQPPTVEQVEAYFARIGQPVEYAQGFVDYYGAVGWYMGKLPMKDWKSACRRWAARENRMPPENREGAGLTGAAANARRNSQYIPHDPVPFDPYGDIHALLERQKQREQADPGGSPPGKKTAHSRL